MNLQPWQNFYLLAGGAAATLTGLMFVAVTFGARLVSKAATDVARAFLDPIVFHFVHVFLISCWMLLPAVHQGLLAPLLFALGALRLAGLWWVTRRLLIAHRTHQDLAFSDWAIYVLAPIVCYATQLFAAVRVHQGAESGLLALAATTLFLLVVAIVGAWELFVWIAQQELSDSK